jgi:hypothetical protein
MITRRTLRLAAAAVAIVLAGCFPRGHKNRGMCVA